VTIPKGLLRAAAKESFSFREMARKLSSNGYTVKRLVEAYGIDVGHFAFGKVYTSCVGKTYGRLTVLEVFKDSLGRWRAKCSCSCGTSDTVRRLDSVISLKVVSCGCGSKNRPLMQGPGNPSFKGCREIRAAFIHELKRSAKRRDLHYDLTKEFLWKLYKAQDKRCSLSGLPIGFSRIDYPQETTASLDRVDSSKGYLKDNVQWVHKDVNRMKGAFDQGCFLKLCSLLSLGSKSVDIHANVG